MLWRETFIISILPLAVVGVFALSLTAFISDLPFVLVCVLALSLKMFSTLRFGRAPRHKSRDGLDQR